MRRCAIRGGSTGDAIVIDPPQMPRRWGVEQTCSWFGRNRRLAKEFENVAVTPARFATLAFIQPTFRRLAGAQVVNSITHGWQCVMTTVGKSNGEGTFAGTRGDDKAAPIPAVAGAMI